MMMMMMMMIARPLRRQVLTGPEQAAGFEKMNSLEWPLLDRIGRLYAEFFFPSAGLCDVSRPLRKMKTQLAVFSICMQMCLSKG